MTTILIVLYMLYFGLGMPSGMFGSSWPIVLTELNTDFSRIGIVSMFSAVAMVLGSSFCGRLIKRFDTGSVVLMSTLMLSAVLAGLWLTPSFLWMVAVMIPLGLSAGALDTAINNYMALHYSPSQMNWLHFFWGGGSASGPIIMSFFIGRSSWRHGYLAVAGVLLFMTLVSLTVLPRWRKTEIKPTKDKIAEPQNTESQNAEPQNLQSPFKIPGVLLSMAFFFLYYAMYMCVSTWGSGYLVGHKNIPADSAARWLSMFYIGVTAGRLVSGFAALKINNRRLISIGLCVSAVGAAVMILPLPQVFTMLSFLITGFGISPVYPSMLKETPSSFGEVASQSVIGYQIASMGVGGIIIPPIFGAVVSVTGIKIMPYFLFMSIVALLICAKAIDTTVRKARHVSLAQNS